ncbi:hypothetical protein GOBAR_DD16929 [Gossypium barbadense]|nr:hypothetical protein GOBAR_DD16929 [Gossypium barbadense]
MENIYKINIKGTPFCLLCNKEVVVEILDEKKGKKVLNVIGTIERIKNAFQEVIGALTSKHGEEHSMGGSKSVERWTLPNTGWLKVNCDGAGLKNAGKSSMGVVVRNDNSVVAGGEIRKIGLCR